MYSIFVYTNFQWKVKSFGGIAKVNRLWFSPSLSACVLGSVIL